MKVLSMNSFSVGINFILGLLSVRIVAQFLGPTGMAFLGSFRNFTALFKSVSTLGVNAAVVRLFVENKDDKEELSKIYSTFFWILLLTAIFFGIIIVVFAAPISSYLFAASNYSFAVRMFGLLLPFFSLNIFWIAIYNGLEQFKWIVVIQILSSIFTFLLTIGLIYYQKLNGALIATAVSDVIMLIITLIVVSSNKKIFDFRLKRIIQRDYFTVIRRFSSMALLSAVIVPLTLILIRKVIMETTSVESAGIWDAMNRISGFYMMFFTSGLSMYYLPKLAELKTDDAFLKELKYYFKTLVPLFLLMLLLIFIFKNWVVKIALTTVFYEVKEIIIWQLLGDFLKIMSLAFGYQILVKTMMKKYFAVEIVFNGLYFLLAYLLVKTEGVEGVAKAYFFANLVSLLLMLLLFRKLFTKNESLTQ